MKKWNKFVILLLAYFLNPATMFGQVRADYDKDVDFEKYKTYVFQGWEKNSNQQISEFDQERIIDAFKTELTARGLSRDTEDPDVGITLYIVVDERTSRTAYTNYNGGFGYGRSWGWGPGMGTSTTTYSERDYRVGTIVIDFYDEQTKKLVFQGVLQTEVQEKAKKREKTIPKNIARLMGKYPVKKTKK